jgi:glycosyltransferase involved in cell wall biosynthesis
MIGKFRIAFAWSGFPDYAARCIRAVIDRHPGQVDVIGTPPVVPIEGMEDSLGQSVTWIQGSESNITWSDLGLECPDLFFRGGHFLPAFRNLGLNCKQNGGWLVTQSDATWQGTLRQKFIDPIRHRFFLNLNVDGCFVPGKSGIIHARNMGYNPQYTHKGLLGADPKLFGGGVPASQRPKRFLFIGNLTHGKNILGLCEAFQRFACLDDSWELHICGTGPLESALPKHPLIKFHGFQQPAVLARILSEARVLVLPSYAEAWGLVVHEAALSGCALAVSKAVGARHDFCAPNNSMCFHPADINGMYASLQRFANWTNAQWDLASEISRIRAGEFGPQHFANSVDLFADKFRLRDNLIEMES